jgi:hypothetical protein
MKKTFCLLIISILANYQISTLSAQVPTASGNYQWVKGFGSFNQVSGQDEQIRAMKLDNAGNIVVCGRGIGYSYIQGLGGKKDTLLSNRWQNSNNFHGFISKYDCNGNMLWYKELSDSINYTDIYDFVIDSLDNIYFLGRCPLGYDNVYFGDSLIEAWSFNPPFLGPPVLVKLDKNGHMKWLWAQPSGLSDVLVIIPGNTPNHSGSVNPNAMILKIDTIHILSYAGTGSAPIMVNGVTINDGINVTRFTTNGQLVDASLLYPKNDPVNGFGIDKDGNYLASVNFQYSSNQFLDSTFTRPTASQFNPLSTIIKFNRTHVIRHIEFGDSTSARSSNFNNLSNGFNLVGGGKNGNTMYGGLVLNQKSTYGALGGTGGILHFDDINNFKWMTWIDTSTNSGGFLSPISDINGDVYAHYVYLDYFQFKNLTLTKPTNIWGDAIIKVGKNMGYPIAHYQEYNLLSPFLGTSFAQVQNLTLKKDGNLVLSGNLNNNQVIVGTDTAKYYGGNNDMFVMRYGNPCSNTTPLIAAGTPSGLLAKCYGTSLKASWQLLNNNEDKYYIYRSLSASGPFVKYDSVIPPTTTYIDAAVVSKTNYWYAISSHNIVGEGYLSIADSARLCNDTLNGMANVNTSQIAGQLYPNPTTDEVNLLVQTTEINATAQLQITNYIGQLLLDKTVILKSYNNFKIDVANYAGGIYLVTLKTPQSRYSEKLIVVK